MNKTKHFSPLALAVLALLYEAPMHPYRMQQLLKARGKDAVVNVRQRASLYQTIDRLLRAGLIAVRETQRDERRPERTIYDVTEEGRAAAVDWMRTMLATPAREFPEFPAALAHLAMLTPEDAARQLERRAQALSASMAELDAELAGARQLIPRLFLLESEYMRAMLQVELSWVQALVEELASGGLSWDQAWLQAVAERLGQGPHSHG